MKAIAVAELKAFVLQVLAKCGVGEEDAETTAEILVTTDTWGVYTHGTKALYAYTRRLRAQGIKPRGRPRVQKEGSAWALVDGDSSLGMVTGVFAMKLAIAKATTSGVAFVVVRNSCHFGAAGYYASLAAAEGQIGIAVSNDVPSVAAPGSLGAVLGSNPFAFAAPSGHAGDLLLDISTAEAAGGKVAAAAAEGKSVPTTWLVDSEGQPTGDPTLFIRQKAALAPMAGHKGYGLALMIEVLSGVLSGSALRDRVGIWMLDPMDQPTDHSHAFLAINPNVFLGIDAFLARQDGLFSGIRGLPTARGIDHLKIPGEIEEGKRKKALAEGIQFPAEVLRLLRVAAEENGCPIPSFLN
jgi:ureidoglycolate dehydrogenase (NAD+)